MADREESPQAPSLLSELKRRNVFRAAAAYFVVSWLTLQVTDIVVPALKLPEWVTTLVLVLLGLGFPIAVLFAWVFELTPEGIKRESEVDPRRSITRVTGRRLDFLIIGVLAAAVVLLLIDKFVLRGPPIASGAKTIAVLPFLNRGGDDESAVFSDGLAETLTHMLAQVEGLHVAARTSAFQFRDTSGDIGEIGRQLRVRNLLEGSVSRAGDQIRVTAKLIDAEDGYQRWSGKYDRHLEDVFAIQDDIADRVVEALEIALLGKKPMLDVGRTENVEAYTEFLSGRRQQAQFTYESLPQAENHYRRALDLDPDYAQAHLALVETYLEMNSTGLISPEEALNRTEPLLERAAALLGDSAQVLTLRGRFARLKRDATGAQRAFLAALEADPDNVPALIGYADFLVDALERPAEALPYARRALDYDPRSERLRLIYGEALEDAGRSDEALEQFARLREINPANPAGYYLPARIHYRKSDYEGYIGWMLPAMEKDPSDHELPVNVGRALLDLFDPEAAEHWFQKSLAMVPDSAPGRAALMDLHAFRGDRAAGLELARAVLDDGAPERSGARWLALWWLMEEGMRGGDLSEFRGWIDRLYPGLAKSPLAIDVDNRDAATLLLRARLAAGDREGAAPLIDRLQQHYDERAARDPDALLYERVVLYALTDRIEDALVLFARLIEVDTAALWAMEIEPGLGALRSTERYRALMAQARARLARQRATIREDFGV